jgi:hypothetical protein
MSQAMMVTEWYVLHGKRTADGRQDIADLRELPHVVPAATAGGDGSRAGLGSASAGAIWGWADPAGRRGQRTSEPPLRAAATMPSPAPLPVVATEQLVGPRTELPMAPTLLRAMAAVAAATGRAESDIWAEAAREWLLRHSPEDDPQPPPPAASAPHPAARAARQSTWTAIDVLLGDLRGTPRHAPFVAGHAEDPAA